MTYSEIKQFLENLENPVDKLEFVMELGKSLEAVPELAVCTEIVGCSSFVEICRQGNRFYAKADSALVRGIVAILVALVDGKSPDEIKSLDIEAEFNSLNLQLGSGRLNGVNSMISFLKNL